MSDKLVQVTMTGPDENTRWLAMGLPIPHAPHFLVTDLYAHHSHLSELMEIGNNPALTHAGTGLRLSQGLESLDQAMKIAVVLERLPLPWDGTEEQLRASLAGLPPAVRRWLRVEVCGLPESRTPSPESRVPSPETTEAR